LNLLFLLAAAMLEAAGDAIIRRGRAASAPLSLALFAGGALVLFTYGFLVNRPGWTFGRAIGIYVFFFFVLAQLVSWVVFHEPPGRGVWLGGVAFAIGAVLVYAVK